MKRYSDSRVKQQNWHGVVALCLVCMMVLASSVLVSPGMAAPSQDTQAVQGGEAHLAPTDVGRLLEAKDVPPDFDPVYMLEAVSGRMDGTCATQKYGLCRYGNDLRFENVRIEEDDGQNQGEQQGEKLVFDVAIRAQVDPLGNPSTASQQGAFMRTDSSGNVSVLNYGNFVGALSSTLYYDPAVFPLSYPKTNCTVSVPYKAVKYVPLADPTQYPYFHIIPRFRPFFLREPKQPTKNASELTIMLISSYNTPNSEHPDSISDYFQAVTDRFKRLYTVACAIPQQVVRKRSYAGVRFDSRSVNNFRQIYGNRWKTQEFGQPLRFMNSIEYFPLDGESAYIEHAELADSNRHVLIQFSADLPQDEVVLRPAAYTITRGFFNRANGLPDDVSDNDLSFTAEQVIHLSPRHVWVSFPKSLATALGVNSLLEPLLLTATFAGKDKYIASDYNSTAKYRIGVAYAEEPGGGSVTLPPRLELIYAISHTEFVLEFSHPVSSDIQKDTPLIAEDFSVHNWHPGGVATMQSEITELREIEGSNDTRFRMILRHSGLGSDNPVGQYIQIRSAQHAESEFYITTANIFRKDVRSYRDLPRLSPDYVRASGMEPNAFDGYYGIGMRNTPGNGLILLSAVGNTDT